MINYIQLVENTEDGKEDPFKALAILNELSDEIKQCIEQIKPIAFQEAEKYDKSFVHHNLKIERRDGRKTWNFKKIEEWSKAEEQRKKVEGKYKAAFEMYQRGATPIDESTGEVLQLPEVTYSKDVLIVKTIDKSSLLR